MCAQAKAPLNLTQISGTALLLKRRRRRRRVKTMTRRWGVIYGNAMPLLNCKCDGKFCARLTPLCASVSIFIPQRTAEEAAATCLPFIFDVCESIKLLMNKFMLVYSSCFRARAHRGLPGKFARSAKRILRSDFWRARRWREEWSTRGGG